jgi:zinc protease
MNIKKNRLLNFGTWALMSLFLCVGAAENFAQETPPAPAAPRSVSIPAVKDSKLSNGLSVAVVERKSVPLVTVELLVKSGAAAESSNKAGLADITTSLLTKGTKTRNATEIAEALEFLGGSINTGAGWNNSVVVVTVTSDKLDKALEIMSDVVLNPSFKQEELDLLKSQAMDGLTYNLKQPGFLASYVASKYTFGEHPAGGTPESLNAISQADVAAFHAANYQPSSSVLIFAGDVSDKTANELAQKYFGKWKGPSGGSGSASNAETFDSGKTTPRRMLVVDLPNSGQASVNYLVRANVGRVAAGTGPRVTSNEYFPASVLNSVLGGGYSSRLNQEIRIKRGLSYGAGSGFSWRYSGGNFSTRTQTKNESAAEVAELVLAELKRLSDTDVDSSELVPRKSVLTGNFGRNLEKTSGLAAAIADLYTFGLPASELNSYMSNVNAVTDAQIRSYASKNLGGGDLVIVGDYSIFKDDLAKRFPGMKIDVIKAADLDLSKEDLRK